MIRKLLLSVALFSTLLCFSATLSPDEALQRVIKEGTRSLTRPQLTKTITSPDGDVALYVFDNNDSKGFIIVSADDAIEPLLGYSDNNSFETSNIPPALNYWLEEYSRQIQYARDQGLNPMKTRGTIQLPELPSIEPIIKTRWNQDAPYNNLCPKINNTVAPTGCVATSVAQAMKYWNHPAKGNGSITYSFETKDNQEYTLSMDFSTVTFNWENMLNTYNQGSYNTAQADAVATLMKAVGYSVEMQYDSSESGAYSTDITNALIQYFNYDPSIRYYYRSWYNYTKWAQMLYDNIQEVGPVIYNGQGAGGAHSFLLDGYQNNGYFHINWGWGGFSDGYFLLDALDPYGLGIGGGAGGFNFNQGAVVNMKPAATTSLIQSQKSVYALGAMTGTVNGNTFYGYLTDTDVAAVLYQGMNGEVLDLGIKIEELNNPNAKPQYLKSTNYTNVEFQNGYGFYLDFNHSLPIDLSGASIVANKQYSVTLAYYVPLIGWNDVFFDEGYPSYIYLTKKGSGNNATYTIETFPIMEFSASNLQLTSELYEDLPVKVSATIINDNDIELTRSATLLLLTFDASGDLDVAYMGDNIVYSIGPGDSLNADWTTSLVTYGDNSANDLTTQYYPALYDINTGYVYYISQTPVTMKANPGDPVFTSPATYVDNAEKTSNGYYIVEDAADFSVTTEIKVESGYFFNEAIVYVFKKDPNSEYYNSVAYFPFPLTNILAGETGKLTTKVSYPEGVIGETYGLLSYVQESDLSYYPVTQGIRTLFLVMGNSGTAAVGSLSIDEADITFFHNSYSGTLTVTGGNGVASVEIYSPNGTRLTSIQSGGSDYIDVDLNPIGKGVVIVNAMDKKGNKKSIKLLI